MYQVTVSDPTTCSTSYMGGNHYGALREYSACCNASNMRPYRTVYLSRDDEVIAFWRWGHDGKLAELKTPCSAPERF